MKAQLHSDGGARGNPGPAAIGGQLKEEGGQKLAEFSLYIGQATNNQAEYLALIKGLELAQQHRVTELTCNLDSELVVRQMSRQYKVKDAQLAKLFVQAWNLSTQFKKINFQHVPRERNRTADRLVNQALDKHLE